MERRTRISGTDFAQHIVVFKFHHHDVGVGGIGLLSANNSEIARGRIEETAFVPVSLHQRPDIGEDTGTPVGHSCDVPFAFTGKTASVTVKHLASILPLREFAIVRRTVLTRFDSGPAAGPDAAGVPLRPGGPL